MDGVAIASSANSNMAMIQGNSQRGADSGAQNSANSANAGQVVKPDSLRATRATQQVT